MASISGILAFSTTRTNELKLRIKFIKDIFSTSYFCHPLLPSFKKTTLRLFSFFLPSFLV